MYPLNAWDTVVLHHSASDPEETTLETVRKWHLARGWEDIGYHFFIDFEGQIHRGRDMRWRGAHVRDHNNHTLGICIAGNNTREDQCWNQTQLDDGLIPLIQALNLLYGEFDITGHSSMGQTECPGIYLAHYKVAEVLEEIEQWSNEGVWNIIEEQRLDNAPDTVVV
ncbi:MAG: N-acetylmuramoyl-L-alanine amidase [Acidimicrobiia bacterium]